jgi:hypothetical protein
MMCCVDSLDCDANRLNKKGDPMRTSIVGVITLLTIGAMADWASSRDDPPKKQTDEEITKLLIGKWTSELSENGVTIKSTTVYKKDGKMEFTATLTVQDKTIPISLEATWKVSKGMLLATVTKTNVPEMMKEGHMEKDQVLSVDEKAFRYKSEKGKERVQTRTKE